MEDSSLDLKITFSGNEDVLEEIKNKLSSTNSANTSLSDALSAIVQQTLIAAGVNSDFKVKIQQSHVKKDYGQGGGLNANEWMGMGKG